MDYGKGEAPRSECDCVPTRCVRHRTQKGCEKAPVVIPLDINAPSIESFGVVELGCGPPVTSLTTASTWCIGLRADDGVLRLLRAWDLGWPGLSCHDFKILPPFCGGF